MRPHTVFGLTANSNRRELSNLETNLHTCLLKRQARALPSTRLHGGARMSAILDTPGCWCPFASRVSRLGHFMDEMPTVHFFCLPYSDPKKPYLDKSQNADFWF